jgi:hypothetical protein
MRKVLISVAAAGAAVAFTTPAAAQYFPQPQPYGYNGYGNNGYGYNNFGQLRALQARIDGVERQIRFLDRRDVVRDGRADRLRAEANEIERRLHRAARNGLNPYEANEINVRIARLEQRVQYSVGNRGYGYNRGFDRDRDGRDDRYEDDHGRHRDY